MIIMCHYFLQFQTKHITFITQYTPDVLHWYYITTYGALWGQVVVLCCRHHRSLRTRLSVQSCPSPWGEAHRGTSYTRLTPARVGTHFKVTST